MLNACLIGVSGFGAVHYHDMLRLTAQGRVRLAAVTVINPVEEAAKCTVLRDMGCAIFSDYREMLEQFRNQAELCFIPTGIHLHAPMSIAALRAGMNVFVEKPVAPTVQEVRQMQAAEQETGRFVAVGYQTMYARETAVMKSAILNGDLGRIRMIKCYGLWPRLDSYYSRNNWAGRLKTGADWVLDSPFNNALAHQLNMICYLAGSSMTAAARPVRIQAELYRGHDIESTDTAALRIETAEGIPLLFLVTHCSERSDGPVLVVEGRRGRIRWTFNQTEITRNGLTQTMPNDPGELVREQMLDQVLDRVAKPETFICSPAIAGVQTLCVNGAHDATTIQTVPAESIHRYPHEGSVKTEIIGLDQMIVQAFEQEKLFSELGIPWTRASASFDLRNYPSFPA